MMQIEEVTCYRTEDGKTFDSYEEARKHLVEKAVENISTYDLAAFTGDGRRIFPIDIDERMDDIYYLSIRTVKALEFMRQVFEDYEYNYFLEKPGDYRYDMNFECWRNKVDEYQELDEKWKILREMN